jgi:hypothetical protein
MLFVRTARLDARGMNIKKPSFSMVWRQPPTPAAACLKQA